MKNHLSGGQPIDKLSAGQHLYAAAVAGAASSMVTNPIWVVKTRMFTTPKNSPQAVRNLFDGLYKIAKNEGIKALYRGTLVSVFSVSTGAIQFMTYETMKKRRKEAVARKRHLASLGFVDERRTGVAKVVDLSNMEYIILSGLSKLIALGLTYPYQVIRARLQYAPPPNQAPYTSIPDVINRTYRAEQLRGFYKGLMINAIRILPGTCVTFVVYENLTRLLREMAEKSDHIAIGDTLD